MEPIYLTPFQRVVERLMTDEEIRERAKEHDLPEKVVDFILERFSDAWEHLGECENDSRNDVSEENFARGDGRLGCMQSHQDVWNDLARAMGVPEEDLDGSDLSEKHPYVEVVFRHFFDE